MLLLLVGQPYVAPVVSGALEAAGTLVFTATADMEFVPLELAGDGTLVFTVAGDATTATPTALAAAATIDFTAAADVTEPFIPRINPEQARPGGSRGTPGSVSGGSRGSLAVAGSGAGST